MTLKKTSITDGQCGGNGSGTIRWPFSIPPAFERARGDALTSKEDKGMAVILSTYF